MTFTAIRSVKPCNFFQWILDIGYIGFVRINSRRKVKLDMIEKQMKEAQRMKRVTENSLRIKSGSFVGHSMAD